jgi:hypothetical protein
VEQWNLIVKLRAPEGDALRQWAEMEGKSPTMRDDLYRRHSLVRQSRTSVPASFAISIKLIAAIVNSWLSGSR